MPKVQFCTPSRRKVGISLCSSIPLWRTRYEKESCDCVEPIRMVVVSLVGLTWFSLADLSQSHTAILTAERRESPATSDTQHIQPQHTAWRGGGTQ